jgi:hypothetical protein
LANIAPGFQTPFKLDSLKISQSDKATLKNCKTYNYTPPCPVMIMVAWTEKPKKLNNKLDK